MATKREAAAPADSNREALTAAWNELYRKRLPFAAKERIPSQRMWPVVLDHCFARIVLDRVVGHDPADLDGVGDVPWTARLASPAYKNMSDTQLGDAIELGEAILSGDADLMHLNEQSLRARGKQGTAAQRKAVEKERAHLAKRQPDSNGRGGQDDARPSKRARSDGQSDGSVSRYFTSTPSPAKSASKDIKREKADDAERAQQKPADGSPKLEQEQTPTVSVGSFDGPTDVASLRKLIADNDSLSSHRKRCLNALLDIPSGRWTTYAALARHLGTHARSIGGGMKDNPYAPAVPCHRVCAADGTLGGYGGHWGADGKHAAEKKQRLRAEGVRFDGRGKLIGKPYDFT